MLHSSTGNLTQRGAKCQSMAVMKADGSRARAWRGKPGRRAYIFTYGNGTPGRLGIHSRALSAQACTVIYERGRTRAGTTRTFPDTTRPSHCKHHLNSRVEVSVVPRPSKAPFHAS